MTENVEGRTESVSLPPTGREKKEVPSFFRSKVAKIRISAPTHVSDGLIALHCFALVRFPRALIHMQTSIYIVSTRLFADADTDKERNRSMGETII